MTEQTAPSPSFVHADDVPFVLAKAQMHGDRQVGVHIRFLEYQPDRAVLHTRYDGGLVLERHGHDSDHHYVFVMSGEVAFGDEQCRPGSLVKLPRGASFGPIIVGEGGAEILEVYYGGTTPLPADHDEYDRLLAERGIVPVDDLEVDVSGR